jgi:hypothetical protein
MVVGRIADNILVASLDDEQVAILYAADECYTLTALAFIDGFGECLVQVVNEHSGVVSLQVATIVGDDLAFLQGDDVTSDGKVVRLHLISYACSLQGTTSFVNFVEVISQNGSVGYF